MTQIYSKTEIMKPSGGDWSAAEPGKQLLKPPPVFRASTASRDAGGLRALDIRGASGQTLLQHLTSCHLVSTDSLSALPEERLLELNQSANGEELLPLLVESSLLTNYQAARIAAGTTFGLLLGNYRVLDRLGAGGMGIVFKGEHRRLRRQVAIKVLPLSTDQDQLLLDRFDAEMRAVAQLQHPNIVAALDAGEVQSADPDSPILHYYVMEYVPGKNLEDLVRDEGPMADTVVCDLAYQIASALAEAHKHDLVHRDIKPSNVVLTPEGQAKLLDFGLALHFRNRLTVPGTLLGTMDYLAPEQGRDASAVDIRADIYSLGTTLFWCLTGRVPFPSGGSVAQDLIARMTKPPPSVRSFRREIPAELDQMLVRMMATNPDDRYPTPQALMRALLPCLRAQSLDLPEPRLSAVPASVIAAVPGNATLPRTQQILLVDDEDAIRTFCRHVLQSEGVVCEEAANGLDALAMTQSRPYDLILLDIDMPGMKGTEVCRRLREHPPCPHLKIILFSGRAASDEMAQMLLAGADDFLTKPMSVLQLQARVKSAFRLKEAQDRSDLLNRHLLAVNAELEQSLTARDADLVHARNALLLGLIKLIEHRHGETGSHLIRMQRYSRILAEEAATVPGFASQIDAHFTQMLEACAPLHDIGKVGLPDHILMKPGKLDADERIIMQAHTIIGAETLQEVARQHGSALAFLQMGIDIARHHHERWDGKGYPDRLAGAAIPLSARIVALADVYDALRSRRVYKPALSHSATLQMIIENCVGQFDPALVQVFQRIAPRLEKIFQEFTD